MNRLLNGALAGAVGTTVINSVTNLDMACRGRPSSTVPQRTMQPLAEKAGFVDEDGSDDGVAENRLVGLGALGGAVTGVGAATAYAFLRPHLRRIPAPVAGLLLGLGVMAMTDLSATVAGATDPRTWTTTAWLADLIPHALYGLTTAGVVDLLDARDRARS